MKRGTLAVEEARQLQSLGKYDLIVSLGRGGMANVYLAIVAGPGRFNKLLVLKILRDDVLSTADEGVNMFLDEARLSARLVHPNIVHTYEVGECDGRYFLAMEYLDGQSYRTVQQRARALGAIPIHEELRIISETARGLHYAHELKGYDGEPLNVVHRDVSPQNVFVTYDGQVKLLDFGIAKSSDAEHLTKVGVIKGKLEYIAPEQIQGDAIDRRADVFSLGAMLWEAVTGKRFAGGPTVSEVTKVHTRMTGAEPNVRTVQPEVPEALAQIIDRALAFRVDARWPDAGALADALDNYLESVGQKPSAKSLAAFVAPLFAEQRSKTSRLIEQQIEKIKERGPFVVGETTGSLPRLRLSDDSTSGLYLGGGTAPGLSVHEATRRSLAPLHGESVAPKRSTARKWALALGAGVVLALAALALQSPTQRPVTPASTEAALPAATPTVAPSATAPAAAPNEASAEVSVAALVSLEVRVTPTHARATLDGAPVATPFSGKFRKDGSLHHLEISAEHHRTIKQLVSFDRDHVIDVTLERAHERAPGAVSRRARAAERPVASPSEEPARAEAPPPARVAEPTLAEPGADLKSAKPRISRRQIDAIDPYSTNN